MPKGPKGFSPEEKEVLRANLRRACENSWAAYGYKKTSVGELTTKIGISTGAFYLLYSSKEELFCETLQEIQARLKATLKSILVSEKGKTGFIKGVIWHFQEYERLPFLYDMGSPDFLSFLNRLPQEKVASLMFDGESFFYEMLDMAGLSLKVEAKKAHAVISSLLHMVTLKDRLSDDHFEVFSFLLDSAMDDLFT